MIKTNSNVKKARNVTVTSEACDVAQQSYNNDVAARRQFWRFFRHLKLLFRGLVTSPALAGAAWPPAMLKWVSNIGVSVHFLRHTTVSKTYAQPFLVNRDETQWLSTK